MCQAEGAAQLESISEAQIKPALSKGKKEEVGRAEMET